MPSIIALSGGVGGAKLALGLSKVLSDKDLTIIANTADDFKHMGLPISPDLDTLMYTLSGYNNTKQGWGLKDESWQAMEMLKGYGADTWFQLGDRDIATHLTRLNKLNAGQTLTEVTAALCQALGIMHTVLPMSDDTVQTIVQTDNDELSFQHYFVRERCEPAVTGFYFQGIENARPQATFMASLTSSDLDAIIICPSNPFVSVQPILSLPGVKAALQKNSAPVIAVSPIVAGAAIKGPTAKMMRELNIPTSATAIAQYYHDIIDGFVLDEADASQATVIRDLGLDVKIAKTIMTTLDDRVELAKTVLLFADEMQRQR